MTAGLRPAIADYLEVRRSLGYKLARPEKLLAQFAGYLEQAGAVTVTTEHALAWAVLPGGNPDWHAYRLTVGKHGKSRLVPVHDTTARALRDYLRVRDSACPDTRTPAVFVSPAGTRLIYCNVHATWKKLATSAGLAPRSGSCRPRIHDLRHYVDGRVMWPEAASPLVAEPRGLVPAT